MSEEVKESTNGSSEYDLGCGTLYLNEREKNFDILTSSPINIPVFITTFSFPKDRIINWFPSGCGSST